MSANKANEAKGTTRHPRVRRVLLISGAVLAALLVLVGGYAAYSRATALSYDALVARLRGAGAEVVPQPIPLRIAAPDTLRGEDHELTVNGERIAVYEYALPLNADLDAARVSSDGTMFRDRWCFIRCSSVIVDYFTPVHYYKSGRVTAVFVGTNAAITALLAQQIGPQFAGQP